MLAIIFIRIAVVVDVYVVSSHLFIIRTVLPLFVSFISFFLSLSLSLSFCIITTCITRIRIKRTENQTPSNWSDSTLEQRKIDINDGSSLNTNIIRNGTTKTNPSPLVETLNTSQPLNQTRRSIESIPFDSMLEDSLNARTIIFLLIFGICTIIYSSKCYREAYRFHFVWTHLLVCSFYKQCPMSMSKSTEHSYQWFY